MLYIGPAVVVVVAIGLTIMIMVFKQKIKRRRAAIDERFAGRTILFRHDGANFFGQKSAGMGKVRGNGIFIVTDREVFFAMFIPAKELTISFTDITSIETPKSFLGKSIFKPLLQINFKTDAAAWYVKDLEKCKTAIEQKLVP